MPKVSDEELRRLRDIWPCTFESRDVPAMASELIAARQVIAAARRHQQDPAALDDAIRNYDEAIKS